MVSEPLLTASALSLVKNGKTLLDTVGFALEPGRFYGLLGPNGAGKSSLLRILYRAERASSGAVHMAGRDIGRIPRRQYAIQVGALVQEQVNLSGLSLREVVRLGLMPLRLPGAEADRRVDTALSDIGLLDRADEDAARLSGGEHQRLYFAQLLALDPQLYLLDEPNNHLDLHYQYSLLDQVKQRGRTVLASFHDITLAARYCDEVLLLDHGSLVAQGPIDEVLTRHRLASVYRVDGELSDGAVSITRAI